MGMFKKSEPKVTKRETTDEEEAAAALKFATASGRFGKVGKKDRTWTTNGK